MVDTPGDDQVLHPGVSRRPAGRRRDDAYERFLTDVDLALRARGWLHASDLGLYESWEDEWWEYPPSRPSGLTPGIEGDATSISASDPKRGHTLCVEYATCYPIEEAQRAEYRDLAPLLRQIAIIEAYRSPVIPLRRDL